MCVVNKTRNAGGELAEVKAPFRKRAALAMTTFSSTVLMSAMPVFAESSGGTVGASATMSKLISLMCSMFKYVGIALFVWAIIQFILATKRSDADSKADAIQTAVCGVALIGIGAIVTALGLPNVSDINDTALDGEGSGGGAMSS